MHIFPNNTLSAFTVHLDTPLDLGDAYEVGLCEMQYPQWWDNVRRGNKVISINYLYHRRGKDEITMGKGNNYWLLHQYTQTNRCA